MWGRTGSKNNHCSSKALFCVWLLQVLWNINWLTKKKSQRGPNRYRPLWQHTIMWVTWISNSNRFTPFYVTVVIIPKDTVSSRSSVMLYGIQALPTPLAGFAYRMNKKFPALRQNYPSRFFFKFPWLCRAYAGYSGSQGDLIYSSLLLRILKFTFFLDNIAQCTSHNATRD